MCIIDNLCLFLILFPFLLQEDGCAAGGKGGGCTYDEEDDNQ